ncbi:hypothetical protein B0H65DRAFT_321251 [Neurospora tetraspora]|uniref:Uncharacterized protein n=1 Tax=Neurospora tetraspora TaxID=94610 RepID=A0AAE0J7I5_9PEZI|nr:hypothetical protein B0H65DRAFT_321251 [Neurospora tetraspora]
MVSLSRTFGNERSRLKSGVGSKAFEEHHEVKTGWTTSNKFNSRNNGGARSFRPARSSLTYIPSPTITTSIWNGTQSHHRRKLISPRKKRKASCVTLLAEFFSKTSMQGSRRTAHERTVRTRVTLDDGASYNSHLQKATNEVGKESFLSVCVSQQEQNPLAYDFPKIRAVSQLGIVSSLLWTPGFVTFKQLILRIITHPFPAQCQP